MVAHKTLSDAFVGLHEGHTNRVRSCWILLDPHVDDCYYPTFTRLGQYFAILKGFRQTGIYKFYVGVGIGFDGPISTELFASRELESS